MSENVQYRLIGKDGKAKLMFKDYLLNRLVFGLVRKFYNPYRVLGHVPAINAVGETYTAQVAELKQATRVERVLTHLALYGLRINGITGAWTDTLHVKNGIPTTGKAGIASRINGAGSEAAFIYVAVGIGTTAFNIADTALESEIVDSGLERGSATASRVTTDTTNDTAQLVITFTVSGTKAVTESGVFNDASAGTMACRQTFSAINVANGDSLQVTWKIDVDS